MFKYHSLLEFYCGTLCIIIIIPKSLPEHSCILKVVLVNVSNVLLLT